MDKLDGDCLARIFGNLDFVERVKKETVCRMWHHVLQQRFAYSDMRELNVAKFLISNTTEYYQQESINFGPTILGVLRRCGIYVCRLSFGEMWLRISQNIVDSIEGNCHRLEQVDFGATIINAEIDQLLLNVCAQLRVFSLEETSWVNPQHADRIQDIFEKMAQLEDINLRSANFPLDKLALLPSTLKSINLGGAMRLSESTLRDFLLTHPHLQHLHLCPSPPIDDAALEAMSSCADSLTHLSIGHLHNQLNFDVLCQLNNVTHLRLINLQSLTEMSLHLILSCMQNLEQLTIIQCPNIRDYASLALCSHLEELEIADSRHLTNEHFVTLASYARLKKLMLTRCQNMSTRGITTVLMRCQLREFVVNFCTEMTDEMMYTLASTQRELEKMSINGCSNITSKGVSALAWLRNVSLLREVDVSRNRNVDDAVVSSLHNALTMARRMQGEEDRKDECSSQNSKQKDTRLVMYIFSTSVTSSVKEQVKDLISLI